MSAFLKGTMCTFFIFFLGILLSKSSISNLKSANDLNYPHKQRMYYLYIHGTVKYTEASM